MWVVVGVVMGERGEEMCDADVRDLCRLTRLPL